MLAEHGCNVTRSFCYWPDFMPAPEQLDDGVLGPVQRFPERAPELRLGTIPTFIVGHMSGENWDPAWRQGRDLYRDVWLVSQQAWFAELRSHSASASTKRSSAGSSRTRCRCTAARHRTTKWQRGRD